jgi:predicted nuclease with RNAse H fold
VAAAAKGLDLVAYAAENPERLLVRSHVDVGDVASIVSDLAPAIVAIDSPPRPALAGSSRECERTLAREGISSYSTPSDPALFVSHAFYTWMAAGFQTFQAVASSHPTYAEGSFVDKAIEIFPHATAYVLAAGAEPKAKSPWRRRIVELLGYETHLLRTGDDVDAALAALTGLLALEGNVRSVGNPVEGVIILPSKQLAPGVVSALRAEFAPMPYEANSGRSGLLQVQLRGIQPVTWGAGDAEWKWRTALASAVRERALGESRPPRGARVNLTATFYMSEAAISASDLDNLAKPLLDTLFRPSFTQAPNPAAVTGALSDGHDGCVYSLQLHKVSVKAGDAVGIDLEATW